MNRTLTLEEKILGLISEEIPLDATLRPRYNTSWAQPAHMLMNSAMDCMIVTDCTPHGVWISIRDPFGTPIWRRYFAWSDPQ